MLAPSLPHVSPRAGRRCRMRAAALLTRSPRPGRSSHQTQASQALFPDTPGANAVLRRPGCGLTGPAGARRALHAAKRTVHRAGCQAPSCRGDAERGTAAGARRWRMAWPGRAGAEPGAPGCHRTRAGAAFRRAAAGGAWAGRAGSRPSRGGLGSRGQRRHGPTRRPTGDRHRGGHCAGSHLP